MFKIQTLNKISEKGLELLPKEDYSISDDAKDPDGIILRSFKMHDMEIPNTVKAIARAGAGVNNIPLPKCTEKGIVVFNAPGANANSVKELVIGAMLTTARDFAGGVAFRLQESGGAFVGAAPAVRVDWTPKAEGASGLAALATAKVQQEVVIGEGVIRTTARLAFDISFFRLC